MKKGQRDFTPREGAELRKELKEVTQDLKLVRKSGVGFFGTATSELMGGILERAIEAAERAFAEGDMRTYRILLSEIRQIRAQDQADEHLVLREGRKVTAGGSDQSMDAPDHLRAAVDALIQQADEVDDDADD